MIKIYALIDPRNNKPFYIGASIQPEIRFIEHISGMRDKPPVWYNNRKEVLINKRIFLHKMHIAGHRPILKILKETDIKNVDFWERFYYEFYKNKGCELFNAADHFCYSKRYNNI